MADTATIQAVPRKRGALTDEQLRTTAYYRQNADAAHDEYRDWVVDLLLIGGCSFAEVSKATGLSTNTLQRWKREVDR